MGFSSILHHFHHDQQEREMLLLERHITTTITMVNSSLFVVLSIQSLEPMLWRELCTQAHMESRPYL